MPKGGRLNIAAANVGNYVEISVADTGSGMTERVLARAFEPFFTTKRQGSGLGLSQVYDFVKQSGGDATIESTPGAGTVVRLYLPRFISAPAEAANVAGRGELILLVEDNELVRPCTVEMLEMLGYRVLAAAEGAAALRLLDAHAEIRLMLTDLGLPGALDGEALADRVRRHYPGVRVLLTSGYVQPSRPDLLGKPFTYAELGEALRRLLDKGQA
jgi:CheY-like chemotaxis protein